MTERSHAVFLSYASQDAEAAQKICEALRAAGIEVFFDQSELRGGDAWDKKIRHEIHDCVLFVPIVSQHTQERLEGYFRHEWKLATERAHHMAAQKAFLVPVVVDGTSDQEAFVPDEFRDVQWTRLPAGGTPPEFVTRIQKLLSGESRPLPAVSRRPAPEAVRRSSRLIPAVLAIVVAAVTAYLLVEKPWSPKSVAFAPPPHSIAVLPFVNMSADKEQEYFSDGLTEEVLNSLARIRELQVAARTSAFSFKGKDTDIATIARKLNVAAVLEGSVRRSAHTVRVTTQLVSGATGFHLWSETYDRNLVDILKLQTEIATAVASALKVNLLGGEAAKIEVGGTHNPEAFDAYLRGSKFYQDQHEEKDVRAAITAYTVAMQLDPDYALPVAARSLAFNALAAWAAQSAAWHDAFRKAEADARKAVVLAPDLAEGHLALAVASDTLLDFRQASAEYERAIALAPGNAEVLEAYGSFAALMGHFDAGIAAARHAVLLDPLNRGSHTALAFALSTARRYEQAIAAYQEALSLDPKSTDRVACVSYYGLGKYQDARAACEKRPDTWDNYVFLAMIYDKLGRHADAEAELAKLLAVNPSHDDWFQYAEIYAQWGDSAKALKSLENAMAMRHQGLGFLKTDQFFDPLRKEPRFQAIERELKFPD